MGSWETWRYYSVYGGGAIAVLPWCLYFYLRYFQGKDQRGVPYITLSIGELLGKFKEETALEIDSYIGQRMQIMATVQEVGYSWCAIWRNRYSVRCISEDEYKLEARFHDTWKKRLLEIKKGDKILINGEIGNVLELKFSLVNCKLIHVS